MSTTEVSLIELRAAPPALTVGAPLVSPDMSLVGHVPVSLSAIIGTVSLSIEQLFAIRKGDVLPMNEGFDTPVTLLLNGKAIARGELVAVDEMFGIRITELS